MVDHHDSIIELSTEDATRPMDPSRPASRSRCPNTRGVLRPAVGVDDGAGLRTASPRSHLQGVEDQLGAHVVRDRPAHDLAGEDVEHREAVDLSGSGRVLGDVGAPQQVRSSGGELPLHQVLVDRLSRTVSTSLVSVGNASAPGDPQQPRDPLAAHPHPEPEPELGVHPRRPVGAAGVTVDVHDRVGQIGVLKVPPRRCPVPPLIEPRPRDLEDPAGHRDVEPVAGKLLDQPEPYFGSTFSRAK